MFKYSAYTLAIVSLCVFVGAAPAAQMIFPGADWEEATPESVLVDSVKLEAAVSYLEANSPSHGVKELVIIRNGRMIWKGPNIDNVHNVYSVTKSFTSTVLGLLIDDGKATLDTLAKDYVPSMAADYPGVTLRHFATMTSGYRAPNEEPPWYASRDFFTPAAPLFTPPGSQYAYWDSAMSQFGNVLTLIAGEPMEGLFRRRIADPIGMDAAKWDWGDWGAYLGPDFSGINTASWGMSISAREAARFGHLFLNRGNWDGNQLISAEWVDEATKVQVPASIPRHPMDPSSSGGSGVYGYNWWVWWVDGTTRAFSAVGVNGNYIRVIPEYNMVVVREGTDGAVGGWPGFLSLIASAGAMAVWDEGGDGNWGDIDPVSDCPRWRDRNGNTAAIYPEDPIAGAVVRTDRVTVAIDRSARSLTVESGVVAVDSNATLSIAEGVDVFKGAVLDVAGTLAADSLTTAGTNTTAEGAIVSITEGVDVAVGADLFVAGTLNAASLTTAGTTTLTQGSLGTVDTINVTDGTTTLSSPKIRTINATGGILNTAADVIELNVDGGAVNTSADVRAEEVNLTNGAIHVGNNTDLYVTTMQATAGTLDTATGHVVVSDRLKIGQRTTMRITDGTIKVNSSDLIAPAVADNVTLTGRSLTIGGGTIPPPGAIAVWRFEERSGTTAADWSGAGNDHLGTLSGAELSREDPDHPTALRFDRDDGDDYVEVANAGDIQFGSPFTIAMWIKTSEKGVELLGKGNDDGKWKYVDKALCVEPGTGQVKFTSPLSGSILSTTAVDVADNQWHHVVVTFDGVLLAYARRGRRRATPGALA